MSSGGTPVRGGGGKGLGPASELPATGVDHESDAHAGDNHPSDRLYIRVAILLTIVTAVEVAIYYVEGIRDFLVPVLIVLSVAKFGAVIGYFMHLKFDDRRFTVLFVTGLAISIAVVSGVVIMFWTGPALPGTTMEGVQ